MFKNILTILLVLSITPGLFAQDDVGLKMKLAAKASQLVEDDPAPGMAILVQLKGEKLLSSGFGLADVEHDISVKEHTIFRLGSITKQFTSAAIMQLIEKDKLSLETKISEILKKYPEPGNKVTVHQLLNHTSGIPSYTGLGAEFWSKSTMNLTHDELLSMFNDDPLEFEPGSRMAYNNSGYYLLGMIIAEVSGSTYEEYLEANIFKPLGMDHTSYCREKYIIPNRAEGYEMDGGELVNDANIGMNSPYAAGALCSTIGDLATWTHALHNEKVVSAESFEKMITKTKLPDGSEEGYGYGLSLGDNNAGRYVAHGGGINGFSTMLSYFPDEDLLIGVLANSGSARAGDVGGSLAMIALGKEPAPREEKADESADYPELRKYVGKYQTGPGVLEMRVENGKLVGYPQDDTPEELLQVSDSEFDVPGIGGKVVFDFDENGEVTQFTLKMGGQEQVAKRIREEEKAENKDEAKGVWDHPEEIQLDARVTDEYVGEYEIAPNFSIVVSKKDGVLMGQATNQEAFPLYPYSERSFFLKVVEATVDFEANDKGVITGMILHQNGRDMPGRKTK